MQELLSFQSESLAGAFELSVHLEPHAKVLLFYLFFIAFMMLLRATSGFIASSKGMLSGVT